MAGSTVASAVRQPAAPGAAANAPALGLYSRRRPDKTLAYQIVHAWLATWLAQQDDQDQSVPAVVERELTGFLACGILAHGFARARCPDCTAEFLVAFSRKGRGICPSCNCGGAMQLTTFIVESAVIVRILDHLGEPSRALRRAPIRGPPRADDYWGDWNAIVDCDNDSPDPARQVMPDYESQRQDMSW